MVFRKITIFSGMETLDDIPLGSLLNAIILLGSKINYWFLCSVMQFTLTKAVIK